ncbi:DMT family transporter [Tamaricihabitans halophyticus]|nr:DMT family transporter [Tamaricihabitans halophyticus]
MWSSGALAVEFGLRHTNVANFLWLRALGAALISWLVWLAVRDALPRGRRQWVRLLLAGLFLQVGYQGLFFLAIWAELPAGIAVLIVGSQPILTALLSRQGRDARLWLGLLLGFGGLLLAVSSSLDGHATALGVAFAFGALLLITVGTLVQSTNKGVGIWSSLAVQTTVSTVAFGLLGAGQLELPENGSFYLALGWMVVIVSVGATALLYLLVRRGAVTKVASLFYCVPAVAAILDYLVLGTKLGWSEVLGIAIVLAAVALIQAPRSRRSRVLVQRERVVVDAVQRGASDQHLGHGCADHRR